MKPLFLCLAALSLVACKSDCEKASDDIAAAYDECGLDLEEDTSAECEESNSENYVCYGDCYVVAECGALDGTDGDASLALVECLSDCDA
jgi:hypothetical protein